MYGTFALTFARMIYLRRISLWLNQFPATSAGHLDTKRWESRLCLSKPDYVAKKQLVNGWPITDFFKARYYFYFFCLFWKWSVFQVNKFSIWSGKKIKLNFLNETAEFWLYFTVSVLLWANHAVWKTEMYYCIIMNRLNLNFRSIGHTRLQPWPSTATLQPWNYRLLHPASWCNDSSIKVLRTAIRHSLFFWVKTNGVLVSLLRGHSSKRNASADFACSECTADCSRERFSTQKTNSGECGMNNEAEISSALIQWKKYSLLTHHVGLISCVHRSTELAVTSDLGNITEIKRSYSAVFMLLVKLRYKRRILFWVSLTLYGYADY